MTTPLSALAPQALAAADERRELAAIAAGLGADERAVVSFLDGCDIPTPVLILNAARLKTGADKYGALSLDADPRDFMAEAGEEAVDALAYLAMHAVRSSRRGLTTGGLAMTLARTLAKLAGHAVRECARPWVGAVRLAGE